MTPWEMAKAGLMLLGGYHAGMWVGEKLGLGKGEAEGVDDLFAWRPPKGDLVLAEADEGDTAEGIPYYINDAEGRGYGDVVERAGGKLEVVMGAPEDYQGETSRIVADEDDALEAAQEIVDRIVYDEEFER